jgi:hypothetical protein
MYNRYTVSCSLSQQATHYVFAKVKMKLGISEFIQAHSVQPHMHLHVFLVLRPTCFMYFCSNAPYQCTPLLNLLPLSVVLTPSVFRFRALWLAAPYYANPCLAIPLFHPGISFLFYAFLIYAHFFRNKSRA